MHGRRVFLIAAPLVALLWPRPAGAITDARDVGADEYRSVGAIVARSPNGECGHEYVCTATLITSDTLLTAAHCGVRVGAEVAQDWEWFFTLDADPGLLEDSYGSCPGVVLEDAQLIRIVEQEDHPGFDPFPQSPPEVDFDQLFGWDDVSLWTLETPVTEVEPATLGLSPAWLDSVVNDPFATLEMVGYGPNLADGPARRAATIELADIASTELRLEGSSQRCKGDSGGPTFLVHPDEPRPVLVSIASRIHGLDIDQSPCGSIIESRVDAHALFLLEHAPELEAAAPPAREPEGEEKSGAGCRVASHPGEAGPWLLPMLVLLGLGGLSRRRRS